MKVQVSTNVSVSDAKEGRARERAEPHSLQNPDPELERVLLERAFVARRGSRRDQARDVVEGRLVDPVLHYELGTEIEDLQATAAEVDYFGGSSVAAFDNECEPDVFDSSARSVHLVDIPVLHDRAREPKLTDSGDISHRLRAGIGLRARIHCVVSFAAEPIRHGRAFSGKETRPGAGFY